ncbi:MAG: hypothetical protein V4517_00655 [Pseudomonadota bacterium]
MWMALLSFIGGPVVGGLIKAYQAKLTAGNTSEKIAVDFATTEVAAQRAEIEAQLQLRKAEIGHFWEPEKLFAYVTLFFYAKVLIYDKCLGLGTTDAVSGEVATWAGLVMSFYFAKRGFENVARIIRR